MIRCVSTIINYISSTLYYIVIGFPAAYFIDIQNKICDAING